MKNELFFCTCAMISMHLYSMDNEAKRWEKLTKKEINQEKEEIGGGNSGVAPQQVIVHKKSDGQSALRLRKPVIKKNTEK